MNLKEKRKQLNMTQKELAQSLSVSVHTVRAWEQEKNPVPKMVFKLMEYIEKEKS